VVAAVRGNRYPGSEKFRIWWDGAETALAAADAALCKAGTTTLEAALAGVPHAVVQRVHPLTYQVARRLVRIPYIGLVNLILEKPVVPELIQSEARPEALEEILYTLLAPGSEERAKQLEAFSSLRPLLGRPGVAKRVAALALEQLSAVPGGRQAAWRVQWT
jgi:lipid-A-disaccharide synthase